MKRYEHGPLWKPKEGQPYYFRYWDKCSRCLHLQHYEVAKVLLIEEDVAGDPLTEEYRATVGHL